MRKKKLFPLGSLQKRTPCFLRNDDFGFASGRGVENLLAHAHLRVKGVSLFLDIEIGRSDVDGKRDANVIREDTRKLFLSSVCLDILRTATGKPEREQA